MKNIFKLLALLLPLTAFAVSTPTKFATDQLGFGHSGSTADHFMFFDFGTFSTNPRLTVDNATKTLFYNKNNFSLGDAASTAKTIFANISGGSNPFLQYNPTNSQWEFSNDGTNASGFGSGSGAGSGISVLVNAGFESGITQGWSNTGGTAAAVSAGANLLIEKKSATWTASAGAQRFESTAYTVPNGIKGNSCAAQILYLGGDANLKLQAYDGTVVLQEQVLAAVTTPQKVSVYFPCPASGTIQLRLVSTASSALIAFDQTFLGVLGTGSISQASVVASMYFATTGGCSWANSSATLAAFTTTAACPGPSVEYSSGVGSPQTTDVDLPRVTINNLPAGTYLVTASGALFAGGSNNNNVMAIFDGTTTSASRGPGASAVGTVGEAVVNGIFTYTVAGNRSFEIYASNGGGGSVNLENQTGQYQTHFVIRRFPSAPVEVNTADTVAWKIDANIGGSTNVALNTTTVTTYGSSANANLDLVTNPGSSTAYIACDTTEVASGATCTGSEVLGVSLFPPRPGQIEVCADYGHELEMAPGQDSTTTFQLIETPNNSNSTQTQLGKTRVSSGFDSGGGINRRVPIHLCGTFDVSSGGVQHTYRLMHTQFAGTAPNANYIYSDRATGSAGNRDTHWTARYIDQQTPVSVVAGSVVAAGNSSVWKVVDVSTTAVNCTSSPCALDTNSGGVSSITRSATGVYVINFTTPFSANAVCTCSSFIAASGSGACSPNGPGASSFTIVTTNFSQTNTDSWFHVHCAGPK